MYLHKKQPYKEFTHNKEVLVVNPNNIKELEAILKSIIKNPDIANNIGASTHKAITKKINLTSTSNKPFNSILNCLTLRVLY